MKKLVLLFLLLTSPFLFSQNNYEKGYFINNNNEKIECLIENLDWINNPNSFNYKLDETSSIRSLNITEVNQFEIYSTVKFIRAKVKIDLSILSTNYLSTSKYPELIEKELFLKEIVSGTANLYEYRQGLIHCFFYSTSLNNIEFLVYKEYLINRDQVAKNNSYQQQLFNNLVCGNITLSEVKKLNYSRKDLIRLFVKYNYCRNPEEKVTLIKEKKEKFNLTLRPRVNFTDIKNELYDKNTQITMGFEVEYVFPTNKKKWSVFIDPNYVSYKKRERKGDVDIYLKINSIEIPVGIRYAVFLNKNSKIYVNAAGIFDANMGSHLKVERKIIRYESTEALKVDPGFAFGMGYKFKDRYSIEVRTTTSRYHTLGKLNNSSIILGYRIF